MPQHCISCWSCGHLFEVAPPVGRRDVCPSCFRDCRVCKNCQFYDEHAYRSCSENQAEWVKEKEDGNFCGYFQPSSKSKGPTPQKSEINPLDALFSTPKSTTEKSDLAKEMEEFFRKK